MVARFRRHAVQRHRSYDNFSMRLLSTSRVSSVTFWRFEEVRSSARSKLLGRCFFAGRDRSRPALEEVTNAVFVAFLLSIQPHARGGLRVVRRGRKRCHELPPLRCSTPRRAAKCSMSFHFVNIFCIMILIGLRRNIGKLPQKKRSVRPGAAC